MGFGVAAGVVHRARRCSERPDPATARCRQVRVVRWKPGPWSTSATSRILRIEAPDLGLSRWLWSWLLAIPHFIVLAFLWLAFAVLTFVAFFAILFTAGTQGACSTSTSACCVTWRVAFYSYGALGTDRYLLFTLDAVPDYPATLDVAYPEQLSRGLVLVKWWLLAIPHYLLVGIFVGSGSHAASKTDDWDDCTGATEAGWSACLFFAGVALLFTTRYPRGIFDFVLGLDRWVARVIAYAGLMTDRYPPSASTRAGWRFSGLARLARGRLGGRGRPRRRHPRAAAAPASCSSYSAALRPRLRSARRRDCALS